MGESVSTEIIIGGKASRRVADQLDQLLRDMFGDVEETRNGHLYATGERNYGNADEAEEFCQRHGLPYVLSWHGSSFGDGSHAWRPGMDKAKEMEADADGDPALTLRELKERQNQGKTIADLIAELSVGDWTTLPKFEIKPARKRKAQPTGAEA